MPRAAIAFPDDGAALGNGGGIELHVATQWLHEDQKQIAACLGLPEDRVHLVLGGVGGAFGAREDISLQVHTCLLALRLGRPVRMAYHRAESFLGHVHRHPASIWMRHHATSEGEIVKIEARMVFDGGAYASTSSAVLINDVCRAAYAICMTSLSSEMQPLVVQRMMCTNSVKPVRCTRCGDVVLRSLSSLLPRFHESSKNSLRRW